MRTAILFNPSICSSNVGDTIISKSIHDIADKLLVNYLVCEMPTQIPVSGKVADRFQHAELKLVLGSNLMQSHMVLGFGRKGLYSHAIRQWDFNLASTKLLAGSVLWGCGWQNYDEHIDPLTSNHWLKVLNHDIIHSVRDDFTLYMLKKIGFQNVLNTGCPTTWSLTKNHCEHIPHNKSETVITTLTDYRPDIKRDTFMLQTLLKNYSKVYIWLQGLNDENYLKQFDNRIIEKLTIVPPNLEAYERVLEINNIDYVGTRLHGGIFALQHKVRSVIIGIDNRALEMRTSGVPVLPAKEIDDLDGLINDSIITDIKLYEENIQRFLGQI